MDMKLGLSHWQNTNWNIEGSENGVFGPERAEVIESCTLGGYEIFVLHFIKCNSY